MTSEVKNNHNQVTMKRILDKFIQVKFSVGCMVWQWCCLLQRQLAVKILIKRKRCTYNMCAFLVKSNYQTTQCVSRCHRHRQYQHRIAAIAAAFAARRNHAVPPPGPHIVQVLPPPLSRLSWLRRFKDRRVMLCCSSWNLNYSIIMC